MIVRAWSIGAVVMLSAACGGEPRREDSPGRSTICEPPAEGRTLPENASIVGRVGRYTLTMAARTTDGARVSTSGALLLFEQQEDSLRDWQGVATPVYGATDLDPDLVGAQRVGDPASEDPASPGVLVMEDRTDEGPRVRLRLGDRANARDVISFDVGYTLLTLTHMDDRGFAGRWRSAAQGPAVEGWFCAERVE